MAIAVDDIGRAILAEQEAALPTKIRKKSDTLNISHRCGTKIAAIDPENRYLATILAVSLRSPAAAAAASYEPRTLIAIDQPPLLWS